MLTKISILAAALLLSSTSLSACSGQETENLDLSQDIQSERVMLSPDEARAKLAEPFLEEATWAAVMVKSNTPEIVLVSMPDENESKSRRIVRLNSEKGFTVYRVNITCPRGAYIVRDARYAFSDKAMSLAVSDQPLNIDIQSSLSEICTRKARLPIFEGNTLNAVKRLRNMNLELYSKVGTPKEIDIEEPSNYKSRIKVTVIDSRKKE